MPIQIRKAFVPPDQLADVFGLTVVPKLQVN